MTCPDNIVLPTIRFQTVTKDIITHLLRAGEMYHDVHVTIADGQEDEEKKAWILELAKPLATTGRFTYIGLKDAMERVWLAAQLETEWILPIADDDPSSVNYLRCLSDAACVATPNTMAIVPYAYLCYSSKQFYPFRLQAINEPDQRGRLSSLFKQGHNGLLTFGVMRRRLFLEWMDFVRTKPVWPSYSDQLFVSYLAMKGLFLPTREECVYMKDESDWHDLRRAIVKDSRGYLRPCMTLAHEIFLVDDLFTFLRAHGLEDVAVPSVTYRAKELLKSGLGYHRLRLHVLEMVEGTYSKQAYGLMSQLLDRAMSLADDDVAGHIALISYIESAADQLRTLEDEPLSIHSRLSRTDETPPSTGMPKQPQQLSIPTSELHGRVRVLWVAPGFPPTQVAGTELYTLALARELQRRGYEVRVVCPAFAQTTPIGALCEEEFEGIPVSRVHLPVVKTLDGFYFSQEAGELFWSYLQHRPVDLVHFQHLIGFTASAVVACKRLNVPSLMTLHDSWFLCQQVHYMLPDGEFCTGPETVDKCVQCMLARHPGAPIQQQIPQAYFHMANRRELLKQAILQVDRLIVLSEFQRRNLDQYGFLHPKTIVSPIGLEALPSVSRTRGDGRLRILYLGHVTKRKGLDVLMRAFARLPQDRVRLDIYGDIVDRAYFEQEIRLGDAGDNVVCHGSYSKADLPRILSGCDLAVIPSRAEFFPTTVRECLAAHTPVIASSVGGVPEMIEHGRTGLLFRSGDDVDLEEKLRQCLENPQLLEHLRTSSPPVRTMAQDVDQLEQIYAELVGMPRLQSQRKENDVAKPGQTSAAVLEESHPGRYVCSIIIPVWNKVELTMQCLTELAKVTDEVSYEVIVVDNGSTDDTATFLASLGGDVQIISNRENLGFAKACNQGAQAARGKYLVFLNNDTVPLEGWLRALVSEVDSDGDVAVVGSKLLYPDQTVQHAGVAVDRLLRPYHLYQGSDHRASAVNRRRELNAVTAACLLIRRSMFVDVGGFDEGYVNGFEDADLCFKVREKGGRIVYQPRSVLYHLESQTPGRKQHDERNATRLRERWGAHWWLTDEDLHCHTDGYKITWPDTGYNGKAALQLLADVKDHAAWAHVAAAQGAAFKQDWQAVKRELALAEDWPNDRLVLSWGATVAERMQELPSRIKFLARYVELVDAPTERLALVRLLLEQRNLTAAETHVNMVLATSPHHAEGLLLKGILSMQREQYAQAEGAFASAVQAGADRKKCVMGMGMASMGRAYAQGAWERFLEVLAEHPDDAEAIHWLLRAGTAQNRWHELADQLRAYVTRNPSDLATRFAFVSVLLRGEQLEAARREHDALQKLVPHYDGLDQLGQMIAGREAVLTTEAASS